MKKRIISCVLAAMLSLNINTFMVSAAEENILSPIFVFNEVNGVDSDGSNPGEVISALRDVGCASIKSVPINNETESNFYTTLHPSKDIWKEAQSNRLSGYKNIHFEDTYDSLNYIKKLIADGEILSFGSDSYKWTQKTIPDADCNIGYVGQKIVPNCNSPYSGGGHGLTIVGYNDDIWYDINNNGSIDQGERGAFKIANSWGRDWGNDGFMWLSYDALFKNSTVCDMKSDANRVAAFQANLNQLYLLKYEKKKPKAYIELTLNTNMRYQVELSLTEIDGDKIYQSPLVFNKRLSSSTDINLSFDGTKERNDRTFLFDISDISENLTSQDLKNKEFKVKFTDSVNDGNPLIIKDVKLIDAQNDITYDLLDKDISIDGDSIYISSKKAEVSAPSNIQGTVNDNKLTLTWDESKSSCGDI